jgi:hypothetical protein
MKSQRNSLQNAPLRNLRIANVLHIVPSAVNEIENQCPSINHRSEWLDINFCYCSCNKRMEKASTATLFYRCCRTLALIDY